MGDSDSEESMDYVGSESESESDDDDTFQHGPWFPIFNTEVFTMPAMRPFRDNRVGPVDIRAGDKPHDIFLSLVTDPERMENNLVDILVKETNRYAEQRILQGHLKPHSRLHMWRPVCQDEMKAFMGLILLMGIVKKPTISSYWENGGNVWLTNTPSFRTVMSRDRFLSILSNLHANNNLTALPRDHQQFDPMWKVRPVVDVCNTAFRENYRIARDICVDERIVGFKGRHNIIQYISKKKSHQWGAKLWVLSESDTGYTEQVNIYYGRSNRRQPYPHGVGYSLVMGLVAPHFNTFHHVTTDSLFTSPKLCHDLLENDTYSTGTVIARRKGMPPSFKTLKNPKGTVSAKKQGGLLAIHWSDRRQVCFLTSSDHCRLETGTNSKGKEKVAPGVVHTYNENMGGVDLGDQLISVYDPDVRSVKLWKKILFNLMLTACGVDIVFCSGCLLLVPDSETDTRAQIGPEGMVIGEQNESFNAVNAYICHKRSFLLQQKMTHLSFQQQIIAGLIGDFHVGKRGIGRDPVEVNRRRKTEHVLYQIPDGKRRKCVTCHEHKVRTWCKQCKVGLCIGHCFTSHHRIVGLVTEE